MGRGRGRRGPPEGTGPERRALASNDPSERARLARERALAPAVDPAPEELRARVVKGELPADRLRLAALAGSAAAREALGPAAPLEEPDLDGWLEALEEWPSASRRAAQALARAALSVLGEHPEVEEVAPRLDVALAFAEERLGGPSVEDVHEELRQLDEGLDQRELELDGGPAARQLFLLIARSLSDATSALAGPARELFTDDDARVIAGRALVRWALRPAPPPPKERVYAPRDRYAVGDIVLHPKFGRGTVRGGNAKQVDVSFADGVVRKLAHGLGP